MWIPFLTQRPVKTGCLRTAASCSRQRRSCPSFKILNECDRAAFLLLKFIQLTAMRPSNYLADMSRSGEAMNAGIFRTNAPVPVASARLGSLVGGRNAQTGRSGFAAPRVFSKGATGKILRPPAVACAVRCGDNFLIVRITGVAALPGFWLLPRRRTHAD